MKLGGLLVAWALLDPTSSALVERPAPGAAPTAFRIWAAGTNVCDAGSVVFTARSAELLMAEQASRGRLYSIDFDHLSLLPENRPAEAGRAAGWHSLEVRTDADGKPELWAVNVEWCADARAGLEEQPPRWRYFSPAFRTSKDGEVTSYVNLALCINPLTHQLPSLAARTATTGDTNMKKAALLAALAALTATDSSADDKDKAAADLKAYLDGAGDDEDKEKPAEKTAEGDDEDKEKPAEKTAEGDDEDKEKPVEKTAASKDPTLQMASELVEANKRIEKLEIEQLLEKKGKDLPAAVRAWCASQPAVVVKSFLGVVPKNLAKRPEQPTPAAGEGARPGLDGAELEYVNRHMGVTTHAEKAPRRREDGSLEIPVMRPEEWRAYLAKKNDSAAGKPAGKGEV